MNITQHSVIKLLSAMPVIGNHFKAKLDIALLFRLRTIEARFSSASVRFSSQLHDLYDCLKDLETPVEIDVGLFHSSVMVTHTKTSNDAYRLIERLNLGGFINPEEYFKIAGSVKEHTFLDWYSNEYSFNEFLTGMMILLHVYCNNVPRAPSEDGTPYVRKIVGCNEITETFMGSKEFKLLILDLIQSLIVVLAQRTGG